MESDENSTWKKFHRLKPKTKHLSRRAKRIEIATIRHAHKFLVHRWQNVREVRRHMLSWLLLVAILIGATGLQIIWGQQSYLVDAQTSGGTYAEGVVGPVDTLNPLYASTSAERSASRLIFAGLLSYDRQNQLRGDLAENWQVSKDGTKYTVVLRPGVTWHDGAPFTSRDVVFTIDLMKNDETRSPLASSWQSINVRAIDDRQVEFSLPSAYAPFPHALTVGILPEHILRNVAPSTLRENQFGTKPIGTGPFTFRNIQNISIEQGRKVVHLRAFKEYFRGMPKLERFQLHAYDTTHQLQRALSTNEVNAASDLSADDVAQLDQRRLRILDLALDNGMFALFKTDTGVLKDAKLRRAVSLGTDTTSLRSRLDFRVRPLTSPILSDQLEGTSLAGVTYDVVKANAALDKLGWRKGSDGIRVKGGQQLRLAVTSIKSGDYPIVVENLTKQWQQLGIKVDVELAESDDVQQTVLRPRAYDVLIYELALGADPDVYAYWHSSQVSQNGLNFANYSSPIADEALESGRSRLEPKLRGEKYQTFVKQWINDAPAIPLYRPVLHYATGQNVRSVAEDATLIDDIDRYRAVEYWTSIRTRLYETP